MAAEPRAIRIITFSGKQEDWQKWKQQFTAVATGRGYRAILYDNEVPLAEDIALDPDADTDQICIRNRNTQAYRDLVLACTDDVSFEIIDGSTTDELPSRDTALAFQQLGNYWEANTRSTLNHLIKKFQIETLKM